MKKRILLLSSSSVHGSGYLDYCESEIKSFLGTIQDILFIPYASADWDGYAHVARERFERMGYVLNSVHESDSSLDAVQNAHAIFIGGGNTFRLLSRLYEYNLLEAIRARVKDGMPYLGVSAGLNVACANIQTTNDMPIAYPPSFDALGLVPFNPNPHYIDPDMSTTHRGETRDDRIKEFLEENTNTVVGLREGGILHIENGAMTLKGRGAKVFFVDGRVVEHARGDDLSFLL
ncbi:MAG: dipeptidase PepE [Candidatus Uhrbacteria bacterium]|nr:dipeptidase PepE [Candidatus Uhrbacteria bacterium]